MHYIIAPLLRLSTCNPGKVKISLSSFILTSPLSLQDSVHIDVDAAMVQVKAGSLVLLHGANVHYSNENTSGKSRHAYSVHVVEGGKGVSWPADNWCARFLHVDFWSGHLERS